MSGFKNMAIKDNVSAPVALKPRFHKTFTEIVGKYGRMHEPELQMKLLNKTSLRDLLKSASLGMRMLRKGKLKLQPSKLDPQTRFPEIIKKVLNEEMSR